ncbi:MAG: RnfABCDGE type electron transport complex subunit D [Rhodocyclaceae bacterium]|jgi:Na+-translocating ferredoxin:NAD+ oxidoreductase subunit D
MSAMAPRIEIRTAPHVKGTRSVEQIMRNVVGSMVPICAFYIYQFGISAAASIAVVTVSCLLSERLFVRLGGQAGDLSDYSATITGILLALTLPPGFPLWMGAVAGFVAIALGKALFGGIGFNVFNPALVGRAFAQAAFPSAIAAYTPSFLPGRFAEFIPSSLAWPFMLPPSTTEWLAKMNIDGWTGATPLAQWKFEGTVTSAIELLTSLTGHAAVGPAPALVLICGGYLALRRFLDWRIPAAVLGSAAATAWLLHTYDSVHYPEPFFMLVSGGLVVGAVYMATDMATSPVTPRGMWIYGALIGVLTVVIRFYSGLPEGVMYAILIGNAATPLIEQFTQPTPFGKGAPKAARRTASYPLNPSYIPRDTEMAGKEKKKKVKS